MARSQNLHLCRTRSQKRLSARTNSTFSDSLSSIYTGEDLPQPVLQSTGTASLLAGSDSEIRFGDWQTFQKFGAAGARCVPTMVGRAAKKILRSRQPFLIGKWPLLGAIPLVGAQRSSQAGPAAFPSTYTFRMEAQTQRRARLSCAQTKSICTKVGRQCQNHGIENGS